MLALAFSLIPSRTFAALRILNSKCAKLEIDKLKRSVLVIVPLLNNEIGNPASRACPQTSQQFLALCHKQMTIRSSKGHNFEPELACKCCEENQVLGNVPRLVASLCALRAQQPQGQWQISLGSSEVLCATLFLLEMETRRASCKQKLPAILYPINHQRVLSFESLSYIIA